MKNKIKKFSIFKAIENFSYKVANFIVVKIEKIKKEDQDYIEENEIWNYFSYCFFSQIFTLGTVLFISIILFKGISVFLLVVGIYTLLRTSAGGYHCESFSRCYFTSNIMFCFFMLMAYYTSEYYMISLMLSILLCFDIVHDVPVYWGNEDRKSKKIEEKLSKLYLIKINILFIINFAIIWIGKSYNVKVDLYSNCISMGMLLAYFSISEWGSNLLDLCWKQFDKITKRSKISR